MLKSSCVEQISYVRDLCVWQSSPSAFTTLNSLTLFSQRIWRWLQKLLAWGQRRLVLPPWHTSFSPCVLTHERLITSQSRCNLSVDMKWQNKQISDNRLCYVICFVLYKPGINVLSLPYSWNKMIPLAFNAPSVCRQICVIIEDSLNNPSLSCLVACWPSLLCICSLKCASFVSQRHQNNQRAKLTCNESSYFSLHEFRTLGIGSCLWLTSTSTHIDKWHNANTSYWHRFTPTLGLSGLMLLSQRRIKLLRDQNAVENFISFQ